MAMLLTRPDTREGRRLGTDGAPQITLATLAEYHRPTRCGCGWNWCPQRLRDHHALITRPDVTAGYPSDWEGMIAAGLDPITGEELAA
jgi:hypothetical protein